MIHAVYCVSICITMDTIFTIESLLDFYMHYLRDIATDFYLAKSVMMLAIKNG